MAKYEEEVISKNEFTNLNTNLHQELNQPKHIKRMDKIIEFASACIPLTIVVSLIFVLMWVALGGIALKQHSSKVIFGKAESISNTCDMRLVESIPIGLNFTDGSVKFMSTYEAWRLLLDIANESLDIGSLYWTMRGTDVVNDTSAANGEEIFALILSKGKSEGFKIRIAQNEPSAREPNLDTQILIKENAAEVRSLDFQRMWGSGVLHTKLWIVDRKHIYLGSANMDWRSLTQVKEMGLLALNCAVLAEDLKKIFEAYWYVGQANHSVPDQWPPEYATKYNMQNPLTVKFNNGNFTMPAFFSSSPPPLTAGGRTDDIDALLNTIRTARRFISIAVMDYFPLKIYAPKIRYWPFIDDALRTAAIERKVHVRMLISWWSHSRNSEDYFLRSLTSLSAALDGVNIDIKRFVVPSNGNQTNIPFSRVNHNKYMVTDNTAYISTSNWSGDYFTDTAGVALILQSDNSSIVDLRTDLLAVFERDWESPYAVAFE